MSGFPADFSDDPPDMSPEDLDLAMEACSIAAKIERGDALTAKDRLIYRRAEAKGLHNPSVSLPTSDKP